jgi:hypothetical protein
MNYKKSDHMLFGCCLESRASVIQGSDLKPLNHPSLTGLLLGWITYYDEDGQLGAGRPAEEERNTLLKRSPAHFVSAD